MKVCELRFALLFSLCFYGVHGSSSYYEKEMQPYVSDIEASSVEEEEEIDVNDSDIVSLSGLAVAELNDERLEGDDLIVLLEIVKATTQIASGNLIRLTLRVSQGENKETCEIKIIDEPGSHKIELAHSKCGTLPAKYEPHGVLTNNDQRHDFHDSNNEVEELDVDNPEVVRLSAIAVDELNREMEGGSDTNDLMEIMKASAQAISGKITNLILTLKVSQGYFVKICEVTIQQQIWINESKVIESKCENETYDAITEESNEYNDDYLTEDSTNNDYPIETSTLAKREPEPVNNYDDVVNLDLNDSEVINLCAISLIELNGEKQEGDPPLTLKAILKAVLHKYSGKLTLTLKISQGGIEDTCQINFWEDKFDTTHSKCGTVPAKINPKHIHTTDQELDVSDPEAVRLSVMTLVELNKYKDAGDDPIILLEIVRVSRPIGSGNPISVTLKVFQGRDKKMCNIKIFENYKSSTIQLIESRCKTIRNDEMHSVPLAPVSDETHDNYPTIFDSYTFNDVQLEGVNSLEEEELDVNDPEVIRLSTLAMVVLNDERFEEDDPLILLEIIRAATRLSSENLTLLTLRVSQGGINHVCEMVFFPGSDVVEGKVKHSRCGTVPPKLKTEDADIEPFVGGIEKLEVNDPKVIRLSMIALVELYERYPTGDPINLLKIVKASRQIVSGMLTSLTLEVSQGRHRKMCNIQILEQPWLKITKINHAECDEIHEDDELMEVYGINGLNKIIPLSKSVS